MNFVHLGNYVVSVNKGVSWRRCDHSCQNIHNSRLSSSVWTKQAHAFSALYYEIFLKFHLHPTPNKSSPTPCCFHHCPKKIFCKLFWAITTELDGTVLCCVLSFSQLCSRILQSAELEVWIPFPYFLNICISIKIQTERSFDFLCTNYPLQRVAPWICYSNIFWQYIVQVALQWILYVEISYFASHM